MKKMNKKHLLLIGAMVFIFGIVGWYYLTYSLQGRLESRFLQALENSFQDSQQGVFLKNTTDFSWQIVCYLGPYSKQKNTTLYNIQRRVAADISTQFEQIPNLSDSGQYYQVLIFIDKDKVSKILKLKRYSINIDGEGYILRISSKKNEADSCFTDELARVFIKQSSVPRRGVLILTDDPNEM